jgi:molybdopterin-guanine dinucleotide biosynthesis protein A
MQSAEDSSYAPFMEPFSAVVLAGGASSRMGSPKALLRFGRETLIERVVGRLKSIAAEVVVVSGPHLRLPPLPSARIVDDDVPLQGPLAGIVYGLRAARSEIVFVCGCDHPFLERALVKRLVEGAGCADGAVPIVAGVPQPLLAAYRKQRIEPIVATLLDSGERRARALVEHVSLREVTEADLALADPGLRSFLDVDTPDAYRRVLAMAEASETRT